MVEHTFEQYNDSKGEFLLSDGIVLSTLLLLVTLLYSQYKLNAGIFVSPKNYTVQELLQDPSFQRFTKGIASLEEIETWNRWIEHSAKNRAKSRSAISQIVGFEFKDQPTPDIGKQWALLYNKTAGKDKKAYRIRSGQKLNWMFRVAAVLLLLSTMWVSVHHFLNEETTITHLEQLIEEKTIRTTENEQKTLEFSNGSSIVLNSNSTLSYRIGQLQNQTINVSLYGEATATSTRTFGLWPYRVHAPGSQDHGKWVFDEVVPSPVTNAKFFRLGNYYSWINNDIRTNNPLIVQNSNQ